MLRSDGVALLLGTVAPGNLLQVKELINTSADSRFVRGDSGIHPYLFLAGVPVLHG